MYTRLCVIDIIALAPLTKKSQRKTQIVPNFPISKIILLKEKLIDALRALVYEIFLEILYEKEGNCFYIFLRFLIKVVSNYP